MARQCPRCKSADAGDGPYCKHCKFPIGMPRKQEAPEESKPIAEQEHTKCIRCGAEVSHEPVCSQCRADMQFDKLRNRRRW